jgi:UDP-2,3-diacylglucosamine pyrophosphatase LpxH
MGINYKTNIYQQNFHEPYLKTILKYVQDNASQIQDLVILGDWLDFWMYPAEEQPPTVQDILAAHPGVFHPSDSGDFISCMDSIQGNIIYVNGNHDMTTDIIALQKHFSSLSKKSKTLQYEPKTYSNGPIVAEHGHYFTYFNAPDNHTANEYKPLPLGFYMTRLGAVACEQQLPPYTDCAQVKGNDYPTVAQMLKKDLSPFEKHLSKPLKDIDLLAFVGFKPAEVILHLEEEYSGSKNTTIEMAHNKEITVAQASQMLSYLKIDSLSDVQGIIADSNEDLHAYAKELFTKNSSIVILGHTHVPCMRVEPEQGVNHIYANSGFIAPDSISFKSGKEITGKITFAETDGITVQVQEVLFDKTIRTLYSDSTQQINQAFTVDSGELNGGLLTAGGGSLLVHHKGEVCKLSDLPAGSIIPKVQDIELKISKNPVYRYEVVVTAEDGGIHLYFTDQSSDTYSLSILSTLIKKKHEVSFNSSNPLINKITFKTI